VGKETAGDKGDFVFENVTLDNGENVFTAIASTENEGNSEISKPLSVVYNNQPPSLNMTNPSEDSISVDNADFDVVGKSEAGVSVTINNKIAMVDDSGQFKLKIQLSIGKNEIQIVVRNLAGNETRKTIYITYDI